MRRAVALVIMVATRAHASPWTVTGEMGAEIDSNVQRVETGPGLDTTPVSSPVVRFGLRADDRDHAFGGTYALSLTNLTRIVGDREVSVEDVALLGGDLRWLHPIGDRPVAAGVAVNAVDAFPLDDQYGARTFRNLGADAVLQAHSGEEHRLTLAFGARQFIYKPPTGVGPSGEELFHDYDYAGPSANARLDLILWQSPEHARSLELATTLGFEDRLYETKALVNACPPGAPPDPSCTASSSIGRSDRFSRAGIEATWVGAQVLAIGYQLTVIDSNSFGQSFTRHRGMASATIELPGKVYVTLLAILQIDAYLDGLLVRRDLQHAEFTNIEDENRSSAQVHVARKLGDAWSIEGRAAIWRNLAGGSMDLTFHRDLVYAGLVYSK